ncbi:envelope biogenesis factor ElyC [Vibrio sp. SS-MA-C1-2]|uniref:envelope biogenesis factor ElyC n=1 Tax=Vibrio sp. SS-MA-C1-2 TaxID=2908646 RepID=UPI001F416514|nr:envelope biogenesis factor ElyC [Vibrio sp. SS-MA-C1-2]UJF16928.1 envelope biogenesis factor ElyC [Vibrio sp. SS-MA-C1-2]
MFELKKILSSMLMPLPMVLTIALFGLLLLWFTRWSKTGKSLVTFAWVGLFLVSFQPVSTRLLVPLEHQYPAFIPTSQSVDYVMVLGNSHVVDKNMPSTSEISRAALMRLAEGIRIYRMYPGAKLILSGYAGGTSISHARMLAQVALDLGVTKSDILLLETAKDTWEEAFQAKAVVKQSHLVLVTSANHMPRAMAEFKSTGLDPIAAPTNFLAHQDISQFWIKYTPRALYLEQTEKAWNEILGQWWRYVRDWADTTQNPAIESKSLTEEIEEDNHQAVNEAINPNTTKQLTQPSAP